MAPTHYHEGRFPPEERLDWQQLIPLIGPATAAVARYDGALAAIPNPDVLLAPLTTQEAVLSSRIEGTQATMGEVLEFEAGQQDVSPERRDDIQEILNYRAGMREAENMLATYPLSVPVIKAAHKILLSGARGANRAPGEYRRFQNWIGPHGCKQEDAKFVPISSEKLPDAMSEWERYLNSDSPPDQLVQLAVLHAEFEALHPFLDGNGRLGRMIIPLFLWQTGIIRQPMFYISGYLESHRDAYYEKLLGVSRDDDWTGWCRFFLEAVRTQAEDNSAKAKGILDLYEEMKPRMVAVTRSRYAINALDWIFQRPIFSSGSFYSAAGIPAPTAQRILDRLRHAGILKALSEKAGRRAAVLMFPDVLKSAGEQWPN